jgi:hypothetical protein
MMDRKEQERATADARRDTIILCMYQYYCMSRVESNRYAILSLRAPLGGRVAIIVSSVVVLSAAYRRLARGLAEVTEYQPVELLA